MGPDRSSRRVLRARAYAKVNLALEVLGRRDDGFHEIVSITQTISLHDDVECCPSDTLRVETEPPVVDPEENLVRNAAEILARKIGRLPHAQLRIAKRIPLAAGLGGGSSDAAAALRLLNRLWKGRLSRPELLRLAADLGSDVPLFVGGGAALTRGRGELVDPLPPLPRFWLALAIPALSCPPNKTRALYAALRPQDWTDGKWTAALADRLRLGSSPVGERPPNAFDRAADAVYPGFAELRDRLAVAAGTPVQLTGAGPALFALFRTRGEAAAAARRIERLGITCHVAHNVVES